MSQPPQSPTVRMASVGHPASHYRKNRKISAPPQLLPHLEGSVSTTPKTPTKNFSFPAGPDGTRINSSSSTSSLATTPSVQRKELYRHHSSDDLMRNYREQNAKDMLELQQRLNDQNQGTTSGIDNPSFELPENSRIQLDQLKGRNVLQNSAESSNAPANTMVYTDTHTLKDDIHNDQPLATTSRSTSTQQESSFGDSDSVFIDDGTPSTYKADSFFRNSLVPEGSIKGIIINRIEDPVLDTTPESRNYAPMPTNQEEKKQWLVSSLSRNMSIIYILLLVIIGVVCYLMDMFSGQYSNISEIFNIYLMTGQIAFLAYIHFSVRAYINKVSRLLKKTDGKDQGNSQKEIEDPRMTFHQDYGFTDSTHGGSLYLKIGATVFCMGHLIFSGLELASKFVYILHEHDSFHDCTSVTDIVMSAMLLIYAFYQLFFAFKFSNLIINKRRIVSRFGIMHAIGSSLCYWLYMIIQETLTSLSKKKYTRDSDNYNGNASHSIGDPMVIVKAGDTSSTQGILYMGCENSTQLSYIVKDSAPYLYPFSIEFNILMVGFWILLWENHGKIEKHHHLPSIEITYEDDNTKDLSSNLVISVDCHASSRGLFIGLLFSIIAVISIILYFVFSTDIATLNDALLINSISEMTILSLMVMTTIIAFYYIRTLDIIQQKLSSADDLLLYICLPSVFLYAFFNLVPYSTEGNYMYVAVNILRIVQSILQTALIIDGLRRCSNTSALQRKKPGREIIIFLVVMNVASWLIMSFQIISVDGNQILYAFYGKEIWTTVSHLTLPLFLFYRFHSSVCLADIWKDAYEPDHHH